MSWSRRDYETVAATLRAGLPTTPLTVSTSHFVQGVRDGRIDAIEETAARFADIFAADNPRFDKRRFLVAAGCEVEDA